MRLCIFALAGLTCLMHVPLSAQPSPTSAAALERQDMEERVRKLSADIEGLLAANAALQRRISGLAGELSDLRESQVKAASQTSVQEELRRLAERIQEVDRKRQADRELILAEIAKISKAVTGSSRTTPSPAPPPASATPEKGYEYIIQPGDNLTSILAAYNAEFKKIDKKSVSRKQVEDANPGLKPDRLLPGQKIFIPMPQ